MHDLANRLETLRRPKLLVRAARSGLTTYRRDVHLARALGLLGHTRLLRTLPALERLLELEQELDIERRAESNGYSYAKHVEVLIAVMAESRLMRDGYCQPIAAE